MAIFFFFKNSVGLRKSYNVYNETMFDNNEKSQEQEVLQEIIEIHGDLKKIRDLEILNIPEYS